MSDPFDPFDFGPPKDPFARPVDPFAPSRSEDPFSGRPEDPFATSRPIDPFAIEDPFAAPAPVSRPKDEGRRKSKDEGRRKSKDEGRKTKSREKEGDSNEWGPGLVENVFIHNDGRPLELEPTHESKALDALPQEASGAASLSLNIADFASMRKFLTSPLPKGMVLKTVISRHKSGWFGKYPLFELRLDDEMEHGGMFLMCAKRQTGNKTSNYHLSMDRQTFDDHSKSYLGKVRSNFLGNEYVIYDDGVAPKKAGDLNRGDREIRRETGAIMYSVNVVAAQPRDMTVVLPETSRADGVTNGIISGYKAGRNVGTFVLQQKKPKWSDRTQSYNLNFHGRVKLASVKNFILIYVGQSRTENSELAHTDEREREALLFGKYNEQDHFTMDCRWPLSPMQAFAICISSFDPKLACE